MKLTVTIPTYNRPDQIQKQVRDIIKQLCPGVSLVVFDNCSDTPVASYFTSDELSCFTIIRNKINIGRDQNQVRCLEYVDEGWAWTLSDDDPIKDDAVQTILSYIEKYPDYCYLNLGNKKDADVSSFEELVQYFKITGTFGISFFQSACIYNMDRLKKSLWWFNDFLSSQIGQICMVMKHLENNEGEKCLFTKTHIIGVCPPGGWDPFKFIINSSIIIDKYHYKKKLLKGTLFKGMLDMYYPMMATKRLNISQKFYCNSYLIKKIGLINIIRYNNLTFFGNLVDICLPESIFIRLKKIVSKKYNESIK